MRACEIVLWPFRWQIDKTVIKQWRVGKYVKTMAIGGSFTIIRIQLLLNVETNLLCTYLCKLERRIWTNTEGHSLYSTFFVNSSLALKINQWNLRRYNSQTYTEGAKTQRGMNTRGGWGEENDKMSKKDMFHKFPQNHFFTVYFWRHLGWSCESRFC